MLTVTQAAAIAGVKPAWLRRQIAAAHIKGEKITNRMWLVDEASLREWMSKPRSAGRPKKEELWENKEDKQ